MKTRTYADDPPSNGRPLGDIFRDIVNHIAEIVRAEIKLATLEVREELASLKIAAICIVVGAMLAAYGGGFLLLSAVHALSTIWPSWLAALVVGLGVAMIGGIVVRAGVTRLQRPRLKS
jgi:uncharacterized membrane protein YqjE